MVRAGRELEATVAIFEQMLRGTTYEVRSPDFVVGRVTGAKRELDVSVRRQGSEEVLVMVECQDRTRGSSVTWLEQLATKRKDVGARSAVAVSSSGFSRAARRLAKAEDIALHDFRRLKAEHFFSWLGMRELQVEIARVRPGVPAIETFGASEEAARAAAKIPMASPDQPFFLDRRTGALLSLWQVLEQELKSSPPHRVAISPDGAEHSVGVLTRRFSGSEMHYEVPTDYGPVPIATLEVEMFISIELLAVPISQLTEYVRIDDDPSVESAEFRFDLNGETVIFSLHNLRDLKRLAASISSDDPPTREE